jgi:dTDP-L-rhamnose 4-epimerase
VAKHVLITGGAGFVGSHVADELVAHGYQVRALDNLSSQVHGLHCKRPSYLNPEVELITGDVQDAAVVRRALRDIDYVYHFAAAVGVGQSMYEIAHYTSVNNLGTAVLLEAVTRHPPERLVIASSMSLYGEGLYQKASGAVVTAKQRDYRQMRMGQWEVSADDGTLLVPVPTPESKPPDIASIYALSKYDQERMALITGRAYDIPVVALRFFNIYGPRQALSNPYTGVLAIFASRLMNDKAPLIFEDGRQFRDFVSVHDVKRASRLALETPKAAGQVFNIGSGRRYQVSEIAKKMAEMLGKEEIEPEISGQYRVGDIRHCFADICLAEQVLGYQPRVSLEEGLSELAAWLKDQEAMDRVTQARSELSVRGLTV